MKIWHVAFALSYMAVSACGPVRTKEATQEPSSKIDKQKKPTPNSGDDSSEAPVIKGTPAQGSDQPFKPVKNPNGNASPISKPVPAAPQKDIPDSDVKVEVPLGASVVVGLGADGQDVKHLLDKGYPSAISEASICYATGQFSNHARCMMIFNDGNKEWVGVENRDLMLPFLKSLQVAADKKKPK